MQDSIQVKHQVHSYVKGWLNTFWWRISKVNIWERIIKLKLFPWLILMELSVVIIELIFLAMISIEDGMGEVDIKIYIRPVISRNILINLLGVDRLLLCLIFMDIVANCSVSFMAILTVQIPYNLVCTLWYAQSWVKIW